MLRTDEQDAPAIDVDRDTALQAAKPKAAPKKGRIVVCSVGEEPTLRNQSDNDGLKVAIQKEYKLSHINSLVRVLGIAKKGCATPNHPGEHIKNLEAAMDDPEFLRAVRECRPEIDDWCRKWPNCDHEYVICFMCREGRHRSVTAARLWVEILKRSGFVVKKPVHLCQWNWWGCNGDCKKCNAEAKGKKEMFDKFVTKLETTW